MKKQIELKGAVGSKGQLLMYGVQDMNEFLKQNLNARLLITIQVFEKKSSEALVGFYYGKILPDAQAGFYMAGERLSEKDVDEKLRLLYPFHDDVARGVVDGTEFTTWSVADMTTTELIDYIEFIRQYMAENLQVFVYDPLTI